MPAPADPTTFAKKKPDPNVLLPWLEKQGFKVLITKYAKEFGQPTPQMADIASVAPAPQKPEVARPAPPARAKSNQPFTAEDYELIRSEAMLDEWIAEATKAGTVSIDVEALEDGLAGLSFALLEGPWGNVNSGRRRAAYLPIGHRAAGEAPKEQQGALDLGGSGKADGNTLLPDQLPEGAAVAARRRRGPACPRRPHPGTTSTCLSGTASGSRRSRTMRASFVPDACPATTR